MLMLDFHLIPSGIGLGSLVVESSLLELWQFGHGFENSVGYFQNLSSNNGGEQEGGREKAEEEDLDVLPDKCF